MEAHTPESIPDEVLEYARTRCYDICVTNLDKRVAALPDIFSMPKTNLEYARKLARALQEKCRAAGRGDLVNKIETIVNDPSYEEKRKVIEEQNKKLREIWTKVK